MDAGGKRGTHRAAPISTLSAAISFLPPTHADAGILLRGIVGPFSADSIGFGLTFV